MAKAKTARELIEEVRKRADEAHCNPSINDHSELYTIAGIAKQALTALDAEKNGWVDSDTYSSLVDNYAARGIEIDKLIAALDAERKE